LHVRAVTCAASALRRRIAPKGSSDAAAKIANHCPQRECLHLQARANMCQQLPTSVCSADMCKQTSATFTSASKCRLLQEPACTC
jgi:hypothetical protein